MAGAKPVGHDEAAIIMLPFDGLIDDLRRGWVTDEPVDRLVGAAPVWPDESRADRDPTAIQGGVVARQWNSSVRKKFKKKQVVYNGLSNY